MKRYVTGFNGLRTLGVLAVILYHLYPTHVRGGFLGVVLFFVLSGYLVTDSMLSEYRRTKTIRIGRFIGRRLKRIYPSLLAVFFVVTPYLLIFQRNLMAGLASEFFSSVLSIQNWWQIQQGSSYFANIAGSSPFKHLYYLSIEGQFFVLFPFVLWAFLKIFRKKSRLFWILFGLSVVSAVLMAVWFVPGADPTRVYYGTDTRLFSLLLGASLAVIWPLGKFSGKKNGAKKPKRISRKGQQLALGITLGLTVLLLLAFWLMPDQKAFAYRGGMWLVSFLSMILIALVAHPDLWANRIFSNPVFDYIGKRSLGIYLWQLPVFALVEARLLHPNLWYNVLWQLALIVGLSELSYRFVEEPAQHFDWSKTLHVIHQFLFGGQWKTRRKQVQAGVVVLLLAILAVIVTSPPSPRDQEILQRRIMAQQKVLQEKQRKEANAKVAMPLKTLAKKYQVQPIEAERARQLKLLAVGDSVMVAASTNLAEMFPHMSINAVVGEQANKGYQTLQAHKAELKDAQALLVGLGTNGTLTIAGENYIEKIMKLADGKPVFWINNVAPNKPWIPVNNGQLAAAGKRYKNLTIIDWADFSKGHTNWFYSDKIHPQGAGAEAYTRLVTEKLTESKLLQPEQTASKTPAKPATTQSVNKSNIK